MENKYYTPELEDFHVGYEFEHFDTSGKLVKDHPSNKAEWKKDVCDWEWLNMICDDFEHDNENIPNLYRVPYLTEEQIQAEGWKQWPDREYIFDKTINGEDYQLNYQFDNHWCTIYGVGASQVFRGFIKSINELRIICKMISV